MRRRLTPRSSGTVAYSRDRTTGAFQSETCQIPKECNSANGDVGVSI